MPRKDHLLLWQWISVSELLKGRTLLLTEHVPFYPRCAFESDGFDH